MGLRQLGRDRWSQHDERKNNIISTFDDSTRRNFNFYGLTNWEQQLKDNDSGKISTWAIYMVSDDIFKNGLTIYPGKISCI